MYEILQYIIAQLAFYTSGMFDIGLPHGDLELVQIGGTFCVEFQQFQH